MEAEAFQARQEFEQVDYLEEDHEFDLDDYCDDEMGCGVRLFSNEGVHCDGCQKTLCEDCFEDHLTENASCRAANGAD